MYKYLPQFDEGNRILLFLLSVGLILFCYSYFQDIREQNILSVIYCLVLSYAPFTILNKRKPLIASSLMAIICVGFHIGASFSTSSWVWNASSLIWVIFNLQTAFWMFNYVKVAKKIDSAHLYAAISVYILIALAFAALYLFLDSIFPNSFNVKFSSDMTMGTRWSTFVYFSFVTLTTVGYGDITPLHPISRYFAIIEAGTGVFFVAILVSRLISLQISHKEHPH